MAFWLFPIAVSFFLFPTYLTLGSQILIAGLFALSLDLILGYARDHFARPCGVLRPRRLYRGGLLAVHGFGEPLSGLFAAAAIAAVLVGGVTGFLIVRFGQDLTRLMVTLGIGLMLYEAANQKLPSVTGGVDGLSGIEIKKIFGLFGFGLDGKTAYLYSPRGPVHRLQRRARSLVRSPFGLSLMRGIREGERRMPAIGASVPAHKLVTVYTVGARDRGHRRCPAGADDAILVGIDVFGFQRSAEVMIMLVLGGTGTLYGALLGAAVFMLLQDYLSNLNTV